MQTQKTVEYEVRTPLQMLLDVVKSLRPSIKEEPDEILERIKRGCYNDKI